MFFKKDNKALKSSKKIDIPTYILDDRLYEFTKKMKDISKDKDKAMLLARQFTRLIKADRGL